MYSIIAFCCTLLELSVAAYGYFAQSVPVFTNVMIYASPIYTFMHLLKQDSAWKEMNLIYILFAIFHLIKYFSFFRGQILEYGNKLMKSAIVMEAFYLGLSAYYSY